VGGKRPEKEPQTVVHVIKSHFHKIKLLLRVIYGCTLAFAFCFGAVSSGCLGSFELLTGKKANEKKYFYNFSTSFRGHCKYFFYISLGALNLSHVVEYLEIYDIGPSSDIERYINLSQSPKRWSVRQPPKPTTIHTRGKFVAKIFDSNVKV
jgi:hypothetical protein